MRVLWIDDDAEGNRSLINYLSERGAQVYNAVDLASATEMLTVIRPTVLLSDITRGDNANAGLDDLAVLRENESYLGPVIFYTGRVTPTRVERARELGAIGVTNQADTVLRWLQSVVVQNRLSPDR